MEMLQGVWKQHLRPRAVVGYGVKIFLPSPPNYVTGSPGYERAKFNQCLQGQDEPVENFSTDLYRLAEFCEYESLKDEMVVDLRNDKLSEKLQMNSGLTLKQAIQQARQSENVRKQQGVKSDRTRVE